MGKAPPEKREILEMFLKNYRDKAEQMRVKVAQEASGEMDNND